MEVRISQGNKGNGDEIYSIKTNDWETPTFIDVLEMVNFLIKNEDKIYNYGQGGGMFVSALYQRLIGKPIEDLKRIYKL